MTFEELGQSLHDITFVVVDLETTGGSASKGAMITEVGAVKVRGGEVLAEFQTLVNPQSQVPAFITGLTGITNEMVCEAPTIDGVIPAFLEFAHGCVLVAHNAPFDIGFLKHFAQDRWPSFEVIDTARLARQLVSRDEAPNCKLATLAALFDAATSPSHRALADARATVDVLHALIGRVGNQGVHTLEELKVFSSRVSPTVRRKRHLAEQLPTRVSTCSGPPPTESSTSAPPRPFITEFAPIPPALKSAAGSAKWSHWLSGGCRRLRQSTRGQRSRDPIHRSVLRHTTTATVIQTRSIG
ncbi:MAG: exonuclease domain-containing protein [Marmoricola sp.]